MKARKILNILGCFTLIAVTCVCMLFSVGCNGDKKTAGVIVTPTPKPEKEIVVTPDEVQGEVISLFTQGPSNGTTEYTLTAVLNEGCPDSMKAIDWSIAWNNASSTWATGKVVTDYVMVTPTSDGALTAKVKKLAAFGEQVIVTATSRVVTKLKATATVDCVKRLSNFKSNYNNKIELCVNDILNGLCFSSFAERYNFTYDTGTIAATPKENSISYQLTGDEGLSYINQQIINLMAEFGLSTQKYSFNAGKLFDENQMFRLINLFTYPADDPDFPNSAAFKACCNQFVELMQSEAGTYMIKVSVSTYYDSKLIETFSGDFDCEFNSSKFTPYELVTSVSLADGSIIFA